MDNLLDQLDRSIGSRRLLRRGERVLVAVSGGLDSMVLLHLLHQLSRKHSWKLTVAHLNHQLRGRSSDADERLVARAAEKLGLPVVSERADVKAVAQTHKRSIEMAARAVRHEFLARTAARLKIRTVALAHHADDQLELFFLRLFRGSGNEGLAGMKWRGPSPADPAIELIRPLLDQSRAALREFAVEKKIRFREDASNASLDFQRNRIRHELLPLLRRNYQPALARTISRIMDIAGAEAELVGALAAEWLKARGRGKDIQHSILRDGTKAVFRELPVAVQRRCIEIQLRSAPAKPPGQKIPVDFDLVEWLRTRPGQGIKVSAELAVISDADGAVSFRESKPVPSANAVHCAVQLRGSAGRIVFGNSTIEWRIQAGKWRGAPKPRPGCEIFDADKVGSRIVLRHWRPGDRFQPIGMNSAVKLQDLFTNRKIPRERRHALILAATETGELFWVENLRIADRFKCLPGTNRRLHWQWKRL